MRIGQAFFKLNKEDRLSTFAEHKFDVIKIFGVEENQMNNVNLLVSSFRSIVSDVDNSGNKKSATIDLKTSFASFIKLSDAEQNRLIQSELSYFNNVNDLIIPHRNFTQQQINIEKEAITAKQTELQRIEDSLQK